jgi:hypothetical protein
MLGGLVKELILDEPTARALTEQQKAKPLSN